MYIIFLEEMKIIPKTESFQKEGQGGIVLVCGIFREHLNIFDTDFMYMYLFIVNL